MKNVIVIGYKGLVGSRFYEQYLFNLKILSPNINFYFLDMEDIDITNRKSIEDCVNKYKPDTILNLAAYTNVAEAEKQRGMVDSPSWVLNVISVENLANMCVKHNIHLIHFSSDFVFTGSENSKGPYTEDASICLDSNLISWYGYTKSFGENILNSTEGLVSSIVRIAYPYRLEYSRLDFARTIINGYKTNNLYPMFDDQYITPTFIDDLFFPLLKIIENKHVGIFHLVSTNTTTPYEFGFYLLSNLFGSEFDPAILKRGSLVSLLSSGGIKKPIYGGLSTVITNAKLGITSKSWQVSLDKFITSYKKI